MSKTSQSPRAIIHKQILSVAAEWPDAPIEDVASEIPGASADLVERVLDEYGDPADNQHHSPATPTMSPPDPPIDLEALTDTQRETLDAIAEHPDATQRELAERLDVSSATISQRLSSIDAFDWEDRGQIVAELYGQADGETEEPDAPGTTEKMDTDESVTADGERTNESDTAVPTDRDGETIESRLSALEAAVVEQRETLETALEEEVATLESELTRQLTDGGRTTVGNPIEDVELKAKVIRASMADDAITEEEELRIIEALH